MHKHNTTTTQNSSYTEEGQSATNPDYSTDILRRNYKILDDYILYGDLDQEESEETIE